MTETGTWTLDYEIGRCEVRDGVLPVIDLSFGRSDKLNLTGITDAITSANSQSFAYSAANRLNSASGAYGNMSWAYDGVGNRTQEDWTPVGGSLTTRVLAYPGTSNKMSKVTIGAATERDFTYDAAGNIATDTRSGTLFAYGYNARNRLETVTVAGSLRGTYTYNGLEQLAIRVLTNMTPSGTTHFVHDRMGNVIAESDGSGPGGTLKEYIWLPEAEIAPTFGSRAQIDRPLAVVDGVSSSPVIYWVHVDQLARPIKMTDGSKAQVWDAVWAPWGSPHAITGPAALDARFPGQWFQLESGLHYNWHRHYDPSTGRYTQPDPLEFVDGPGKYAYVKAKPLYLIDRLGLLSSLPALPTIVVPPNSGNNCPASSTTDSSGNNLGAKSQDSPKLVDLVAHVPDRDIENDTKEDMRPKKRPPPRTPPVRPPPLPTLPGIIIEEPKTKPEVDPPGDNIGLPN